MTDGYCPFCERVTGPLNSQGLCVDCMLQMLLYRLNRQQFERLLAKLPEFDGLKGRK